MNENMKLVIRLGAVSAVRSWPIYTEVDGETHPTAKRTPHLCCISTSTLHYSTNISLIKEALAEIESLKLGESFSY